MNYPTIETDTVCCARNMLSPSYSTYDLWFTVLKTWNVWKIKQKVITISARYFVRHSWNHFCLGYPKKGRNLEFCSLWVQYCLWWDHLAWCFKKKSMAKILSGELLGGFAWGCFPKIIFGERLACDDFPKGWDLISQPNF